MVAQEVAQANPDFPLRVFTIGIGNMSDAGRKTCSAVADAGHGLYSLAEESEDIMADCTALFEAGRTFVLKNVSVDWKVSPRPVLQTPSNIPALQADAHVVVHALVEDGVSPVPEHVAVHAQRDGVGEILNFIIPVDEIKLTRTSVRGDRCLPLMHTLAARGIVADRQRDSPISITHDDADTITRLGMRYQLQTPFTPLVIVNASTGQTVAVSSTTHKALPTIDGEQQPRALAFLVNNAPPAPIPLPDATLNPAPHTPAAPSVHPRAVSAISAPSENEIYGFPLCPANPVTAHDARSIPCLRDMEARSSPGPGVNVPDRVERVQRPVRRTSTVIDSVVAGHTPVPPLHPAPIQPVGESDIISHLWRPEYWMCLIICGRQRYVNDMRRSNAPTRSTSNDGTPQDDQNTPSNPGTAAAVTYAAAPQIAACLSADATSPTAKASSVSRGSVNTPFAPPEQTLLYLPSRPVAFFDTSARCSATNKITDWKLALFGTPKPRPFCKTRKEEIDRQVQEFVERRRAATKMASKGPEAHEYDSHAGNDEDEEVDTEKVVEAQPEDYGDGPRTDGSAARMDSIAERLILMQAPDGSFPPTLRLAQMIGIPDCLEQARQAGVEESIWATALAVMFLRKCLRSHRALRRRIVGKATEFLERSGVSKEEIEKLLHRAQTALGPSVSAPANDLTVDLIPR